jgi:hypothetical protein
MLLFFYFSSEPRPPPNCTQTAKWILEDPDSSFSCLPDAAISQQRQISGQLFSRRDKLNGRAAPAHLSASSR